MQDGDLPAVVLVSSIQLELPSTTDLSMLTHSKLLDASSTSRERKAVSPPPSQVIPQPYPRRGSHQSQGWGPDHRGHV